MRYLILSLIAASCLNSLSQNQGNIWYFGDYAGVDFNSGYPVAITDGQFTNPPPQNHLEGTSVISDSSGNLLFYTDGLQVWNKNHQVMPNGNGLMGHASSTQSAIIVPAPEDPDRFFYIFTVGVAAAENVGDGLRFSKVDLCLDNGKGDIIDTDKNILLMDSVPERLAVTRHANGNDYWIMVHKHDSNEFWAYQLSAAGIVDTVVTAIGTIHNVNIASSTGQMKFSPNGARLAIGTNNVLEILDVFDFDKSTGIVSNHLDLYLPNADHANIYGIEFSPDNTKLYANGHSTTGALYSMFVQYDLTAGSLSDINNSMYIIYEDFVGQLGHNGLQLGPDNKIYLVSINDPGYLSVIANPNLSGAACDYTDLGVYLGGKEGFWTLPSIIANYDYSNTIEKCGSNSSISENDSVSMCKIFPNPAINNVTLEFSTPTSAEVSIKNSLGSEVQSMSLIDAYTLELDLSHFVAGYYFIELNFTSNNSRQVVNFCKL
jgi:hypothetical protein